MNQFIEEMSFLTLTVFFEPFHVLVKRVQDRLATRSSSAWVTHSRPLEESRASFLHPKRGGVDPITVTIWSPLAQPKVSAFCAHSEGGWAHFVIKLSADNGPESLTIRSTTAAAPWGIQEVAFQKPGNYWPARILQFIQEEDGYKFLREGTPFPFERGLDLHAQNPIATRPDLLKFVKCAGVPVEDQSFWKSDRDAVYLEQVRMLSDG